MLSPGVEARKRDATVKGTSTFDAGRGAFPSLNRSHCILSLWIVGKRAVYAQSQTPTAFLGAVGYRRIEFSLFQCYSRKVQLYRKRLDTGGHLRTGKRVGSDCVANSAT